MAVGTLVGNKVVSGVATAPVKGATSSQNESKTAVAGDRFSASATASKMKELNAERTVDAVLIPVAALGIGLAFLTPRIPMKILFAGFSGFHLSRLVTDFIEKSKQLSAIKSDK